jgi:DNA-binding CsgD family transcriptional regulator
MAPSGEGASGPVPNLGSPATQVLNPFARLVSIVELLEREAPLAALSDGYAAAGRGSGSVALVTGEAGIGKTSLVTEFVRRLGAGAHALIGMCDDLAIPSPLGPFRHLAGAAAGRIVAAATEQPASTVATAVLEELARDPVPCVLVVEDVQWADDASIDVLTVVARRIEHLPAMLVITHRGATLPGGGSLRSLLGALPSDATTHLPLEPLSPEAVASMGGHWPGLYDLTDGNPFFVSQLLTASAGDMPPSVSNAVLALSARLDSDGQRLIELVSVVPTRAEASLLDVAMPEWSAAAEEPERRGLVQVGADGVRFRHELSRVAIRSSIPVARRRRIHADVLSSLIAIGAEPAEIVHHAEAAGDLEAVAQHALVAARRAAVAGATREAYAHFRRAADFADRLVSNERADLFEQLAMAAYTANHQDAGLDAITRAIDLRRSLGDAAGVGRCLRIRSRIQWYAGDGGRAREAARASLDVLHPLGPSVELGWTLSSLSQLAMLSGQLDDTLRWGQQAVDIAARFDDERLRAHALVNIGAARTEVDVDDAADLHEAFRVADAVRDRHEAVRALLNLSGNLFEWVRPAEAWEIGERAIDYAERHQVDALLAYLRAMRARMLVRFGTWQPAREIALREAEREESVAQLLAKLVLAEIAVRRGDSDAETKLADIADQADRTAELQHIEPVLELEIERALLADEPMPQDRVRNALPLAEASRTGWEPGRLRGWSSVAGVDIAFDGRIPRPHAAMAASDWREAADAFGEVGWTYDRALFLSMLDEEPSLIEALTIARELGAAPLEARVSRRMRGLGLRVPRGPRSSTRSNPLGLTDRQLEVLRLLAQGRTNAEIADRLVVSPRTAEHHVAAVLAKLGVASRREAERRAVEHGLDG